jgi:hypothetical protein
MDQRFVCRRQRYCTKEILGTLDCGFLYATANQKSSDGNKDDTFFTTIQTVTVVRKYTSRTRVGAFTLDRPLHVGFGPSPSLLSEVSILETPPVGKSWFQIISFEQRSRLLALFGMLYSKASVEGVFLDVRQGKKKHHTRIYVPRANELHTMYQEKRERMHLLYARNPDVSLEQILSIQKQGHVLQTCQHGISKLCLFHAYELRKLNRLSQQDFEKLEDHTSQIHPNFVLAMRMAAAQKQLSLLTNLATELDGYDHCHIFTREEPSLFI